MGEAKRRKATDPNYGIKPQKRKLPEAENPLLKQIKGMSGLELGLWAIFLGTSVILATWGFTHS